VNWPYYIIDAVFIIVGLFVIFRGYKKGAINQIIWLGSFISAFLVGSYFSYDLVGILGFEIISSGLTIAIAFIIIVLVTIFLMHLIGKWITKILNLSIIGLINSILGALLGSAIYLIIVAIVISLVMVVNPKINSHLEKTITFNQIMKFDRLIMDVRIIKMAEH
jgi:membrane protein required for colicin V production